MKYETDELEHQLLECLENLRVELREIVRHQQGLEERLQKLENRAGEKMDPQVGNQIDALNERLDVVTRLLEKLDK